MSMKDVPQNVALPQTASFNLKPTGVPAKRTRINIQPYQAPSGNITSNQLIQFYIPSRQSTLIDPQTMYLKGTITGVTCTTNGKARLNRNAFSIINRLQVRGQDSTLLEDIQNYNDLCHVLTDAQMDREDKINLSTMYAGNDSTYFIASNQVAQALPASGGVQSPYTALTLSNAADIGVNFANAVATIDFCIPIVSGAVGLLADNLIPTGWLNADLRLDLYTELPNVAFRAHAADFTGAEAVTAYQLTNLELVVDQINVEGDALHMIESIAPKGGPLYLHASTWSTYTTSITNGYGPGFMSQLVPHRSLSVKQYLSSTHIANANGYDSFARVLPYGSTNLQLGLNLGGVKVPQKAVQTVAEAFAELQKSQHSLNQVIMNGSITRSEYSKARGDCNSIANALSCKPIIGFDLEVWDKKGSTIINGYNFTGLNAFVEGYVSDSVTAQTALGANLNTNHFVNYDCIYVVQDGVISVRF